MEWTRRPEFFIRDSSAKRVDGEREPSGEVPSAIVWHFRTRQSTTQRKKPGFLRGDERPEPGVAWGNARRGLIISTWRWRGEIWRVSAMSALKPESLQPLAL